jgi:hypothetical protein
MNLRAILGAMLLSLLIGCGSGSSGSSASVNGTIRGKTMQVADTISVGGATLQTSTGPINAGVIAFSSSGGICGKVTAGQQPKSTQYLIFFVVDVNLTTGQTSAPVAAGAYTVFSGAGQPPSKLAEVLYSQTDTNCQAIVAAGAAGLSGTVTLTSVSGGSYAGTFDVTLDSGDRITGSFSASNCAALATFLNLPSTTCV